jgi:hypothetical protein
MLNKNRQDGGCGWFHFGLTLESTEEKKAQGELFFLKKRNHPEACPL